jgi:hypothetical protein
MKISIGRLSKALEERGLTPDQIFNFLAIARGESGYRFEAQNPKGNDNSWGLFQINFTKAADGVGRAKALGIPVKANGLPTLAGLAKYFGLKRNADGTYSVRDGVSEEELIKANLDALTMMWNGKDYGAWSVHPDNAKFDENQRAQDLWYGTDDRIGHVGFVTQVLEDSDDPTLNTILVESQSEGADVEEWPDIQSGRIEDPQFATPSQDETSPDYTGPVISDHDPRAAELITEETLGDETDLDREASYRLKQELAQAAFDEVRERLETETDYATRSALLQRYEELADELSLNEYGEYEMGEVQSEAFTDALLGAPNQYGELEMNEEDSALTLEALLRMDLSDEERRFIREEMGNVSFWTQDRDDLMVTTPDGRRMNVIKWITEHKGQMPDDEILWWMNQTTYVQNNADGIRERDVAWFDAGPGVREQLLENPGKNGTGLGRSEILREAQKIGFNWLQDNPALLDKLAYDSYRFGWDGYDVKRALAGVNTFESADLARGTILANRQSVMDTAARYYMPVSAEGADDMAWDMYLGEETLDSVEAMYREQAKGQFPTLSGLIDQGVSMRAYFDPYKQRIGQLLEMSDVDLMNDARFQPIMFPGAGGGPMSLSEAQTFTRSLPEWQYTKNAEDAARSMADNVGRMMGVVA